MPQFPISLFTACAPWLPLAELAPRARAAGYAGLDLACKMQVYDPARAPAFDNNAAVIDLGTLDRNASAVAAILQEHGLACPVLAGYALPHDVASARRLAAGARVLGAPCVRLWIPRPGREGVFAQFADLRANWRELAAIAAGEGCRFVMETHEGTLAPGASACLRLLDGLDARHVGVILDVANTVREAAEDLDMALGLLGPYLAHVHVKDLTVRADGAGWNGLSSSFTPLGEGILRWPQILAMLTAHGYRGWLAVENFTGSERGPDRIGDDITWLRAQIAAAEAAETAVARGAPS